MNQELYNAIQHLSHNAINVGWSELNNSLRNLYMRARVLCIPNNELHDPTVQALLHVRHKLALNDLASRGVPIVFRSIDSKGTNNVSIICQPLDVHWHMHSALFNNSIGYVVAHIACDVRVPRDFAIRSIGFRSAYNDIVHMFRHVGTYVWRFTMLSNQPNRLIAHAIMLQLDKLSTKLCFGYELEFSSPFVYLDIRPRLETLSVSIPWFHQDELMDEEN